MKTKRKVLTFPRLVMLGLFCCILLFAPWFLMRSLLVKNLSRTIASFEQQGYQIGHGGITVTGFPFSMQLGSNNISVTAPPGQNQDVSKDWAVKLDHLKVRSAHFNPLSWKVEHLGTARIDMHGIDRARYMFDIRPANFNAHGAVNLSGGLKTAHFNMGASQMNALVGSPPALVGFKGVQGDFTTEGINGRLILTGDNLIVSKNHLGPLGEILGRDFTQFKIDAVIANWPVLETQGTQYWQNNMGRVTSKNTTIKWGQLDVIADFDIGFNNGKPDGIIHLFVKDTPVLFSALADLGQINPVIISQGRNVLKVLKTDENGRQKIELVLRDGTLKYGFIPLYQF